MAESPASRCRYCQGVFPEEVLRLHGGFCSPGHAEAFQSGGEDPGAQGHGEGCCQWCGTPLPLLARLKGDRFCSKWHEQQHYRRQAESILDRVRRYRRQGGGSRLHAETVKVNVRPRTQPGEAQVSKDEPPAPRLEQGWKGAGCEARLRGPELNGALRTVVPGHGDWTAFPYWRESQGVARRPAAATWQDCGAAPVAILPMAVRAREIHFRRGALASGLVRGYHANHGAIGVERPGPSAVWLGSGGAGPSASVRFRALHQEKALAFLPARGWLTKIPGPLCTLPSAAARPVFHAGQGPVTRYPSWAGHRWTRAETGSLPHTARPCNVSPAEALASAASEQPGWKDSGIRQELSTYHPALGRPAAGQAPEKRLRKESQGPGALTPPARTDRSGPSLDGVHADAAWIEGRAGILWGNPGVGTGSRGRLPEPFLLRLPMAEQAGSTSGLLPASERAGARMLLGPGTPRVPDLGRAILLSTSMGRFWPATKFAIQEPAGLRQSAAWTHEPSYLWELAPVIPAWSGHDATRSLGKRTVVLPHAAPCDGVPPAPQPQASWVLTGRWIVEAGQEAVSPPVLAAWRHWKPEAEGFTPAVLQRVEFERPQPGAARWEGSEAAAPPGVPVVFLRDTWMPGFGRNFLIPRGAAQDLVTETGLQPCWRPERLRLPHLICRFPRIGLAGSAGRGGVGQSIFRLSGA